MKNKNFSFGHSFVICAGFLVLVVPSGLWAQSKPVVVETIIARVNDDIITLSDYDKAQATLHGEVAQDCQGCTPAILDAKFNDHAKDLLRDLIDQSLLVQRAKDQNISVETDLIKRLDEVRKQNNLGTMEDLEKGVESSGVAWEDYKNTLRNQLLTQEVIRHQVHIDIGSEEVKTYYEAHKQEFVRPEQVVLSEIILNTDGKSPEEIATIQKKAEDIRNRVAKGEDFGEIAKRYSEGPTAKDGGPLGVFERGQMPQQLEDVVFKMDKGQITEVTQVKTGFEILKVENHFQAGEQPLDKVEDEIRNKLFGEKMKPQLRTFLAQLREESYVTVKAGYTDSAAVAGASVIQEVAPTPDADKKKKKSKAAS